MTTQGVVPNAKDDTLFFGESATGTLAELAVDQSQWGIDGSAGASIRFTGARFLITGARCIEFTIDAANTSGGFLYDQGSGANQQGLFIDSGTAIPIVNGSSIGALVLPGVSGSADTYHIAWSSEPNPLTTGASDAMRSELQIWNIDDNSFAKRTYAHAAFNPTDDVVFLANNSTETSAYTGDIFAIRLSAGRFHTSTEGREDFVFPGSTPVLEYETRIEPMVPDVASGMGAVDECAGPVYALAAADAQANDLILASPLVNAMFADTPDLAGTFAANTQWLLMDDTFRLHGQYLFMRTVPRTVNRVRCRVHMARWGTDNRSVQMRLYSMNRPVVAGNQLTNLDPGLVVYHTPTVTSMSNHPASGVGGYRIGAWFDLGTTTIARSNADRTWLCLGVDISTVTVNYRIDGIVVEPVLDNGNGGLGGIGGFG